MADDQVAVTIEDTQSNPAQERITQLSDKVKSEAEARVKAETALAEAQKDKAFAEGYADVVGTYPAAKEFKADIQAKVNSGYSVEDATLAVLAKAGKLGGGVAPIVQDSMSPAGGSASTSISQDTNKSVSEMSQAEKRAALAQLSPQEMFSPFRAN